MTYKRPIESPREEHHVRRGKPFNWAWLGAALLALFAVLFFLVNQNFQAPSTSDSLLTGDRETILQRIVDEKEDSLLPYDESWEIALREKDYTKARQELESLLSNSLQMAHFTRHCYFLGVLYLYAPAPERNLDRAIEYLQIGRQFNADANLFLLQAYMEAGKTDKARQLVDKIPGLREQLPSELQKNL